MNLSLSRIPSDAIQLFPVDLKRIIFASFVDISSRLDINGFDRSLGPLGMVPMPVVWGGINERLISGPRHVLVRTTVRDRNGIWIHPRNAASLTE